MEGGYLFPNNLLYTRSSGYSLFKDHQYANRTQEINQNANSNANNNATMSAYGHHMNGEIKSNRNDIINPQNKPSTNEIIHSANLIPPLSLSSTTTITTPTMQEFTKSNDFLTKSMIFKDINNNNNNSPIAKNLKASISNIHSHKRGIGLEAVGGGGSGGGEEGEGGGDSRNIQQNVSNSLIRSINPNQVTRNRARLGLIVNQGFSPSKNTTNRIRERPKFLDGASSLSSTKITMNNNSAYELAKKQGINANTNAGVSTGGSAGNGINTGSAGIGISDYSFNKTMQYDIYGSAFSDYMNKFLQTQSMTERSMNKSFRFRNSFIENTITDHNNHNNNESRFTDDFDKLAHNNTILQLEFKENELKTMKAMIELQEYEINHLKEQLITSKKDHNLEVFEKFKSKIIKYYEMILEQKNEEIMKMQNEKEQLVIIIEKEKEMAYKEKSILLKQLESLINEQTKGTIINKINLLKETKQNKTEIELENTKLQEKLHQAQLTIQALQASPGIHTQLNISSSPNQSLNREQPHSDPDPTLQSNQAIPRIENNPTDDNDLVVLGITKATDNPALDYRIDNTNSTTLMIPMTSENLKEEKNTTKDKVIDMKEKEKSDLICKTAELAIAKLTISQLQAELEDLKDLKEQTLDGANDDLPPILEKSSYMEKGGELLKDNDKELLKDENTKLHALIKDLNTRIRSHQQEIYYLTQENTHLSFKLNNLMGLISPKGKDINKIKPLDNNQIAITSRLGIGDIQNPNSRLDQSSKKVENLIKTPNLEMIPNKNLEIEQIQEIFLIQIEKLNLEIANKTKEIEDFKVKCEKLTDIINQLESLIHIRDKENEIIIEENTKLRLELQKLESLLHEKTKEIDNLHELNPKLHQIPHEQGIILNLESKISQKKMKEIDLAQDLTEKLGLQHENSMLLSNLLLKMKNMPNDENKKYESRMIELEELNQLKTKKIESIQEDKQKLEELKEKLDSMVENQAKEINRLSNKNKDLEEKVDRLNQEYKTCLTSLEDKNRQLSEHEKEKLLLLVNHSKEKDHLTIENTKLRSDNDTLLGHVNQSTIRLEEALHKIQGYVGIINGLKVSEQQSKTRIEQLEHENAKLTQEIIARKKVDQEIMARRKTHVEPLNAPLLLRKATMEDLEAHYKAKLEESEDYIARLEVYVTKYEESLVIISEQEKSLAESDKAFKQCDIKLKDTEKRLKASMIETNKLVKVLQEREEAMELQAIKLKLIDQLQSESNQYGTKYRETQQELERTRLILQEKEKENEILKIRGVEGLTNQFTSANIWQDIGKDHIDEPKNINSHFDDYTKLARETISTIIFSVIFFAIYLLDTSIITHKKH